MAISVADNFSYQGGKPLDARLKFDTITAMVNTPAASLYDGCLAYVVAEKKYYSYDSSNTSSETLGKWVELSTGGASYTPGDGIEIDSNNVISTANMSAVDMSEIVTPLPSVMSRLMKYSTDEQIVGEWIDGSPLYQKTFNFNGLPNKTEKNVAHGISSPKFISLTGYAYNSNNGKSLPLLNAGTSISSNILTNTAQLYADGTNISIYTTSDLSQYAEAYVTARYVKVTV